MNHEGRDPRASGWCYVERAAGVYVFSLSTLNQESFLHGRFQGVKGNEDGSYIAALSLSGEISVCTIENGMIRRVSSFSPPLMTRRVSGSQASPLLLVSGANVYQSSDIMRRDCIHVLDGKSEIMVRSLKYFRRDAFTETTIRPVGMVSNGRGLFCCFNFGVDERRMCPIKAYAA